MTWAGLALLLLAELLFLSLRHDVADFAGRADWFGRLVALASVALRVGVTSAVVVLTLTAWRLRRRFARAVRELGLVPGFWPWLPMHLAAFALLAHFSDRILANPLLADQREVAAWWGAVLSTGLFWLAAAVPPRFWPGLVRSGRRVLLAGFAVGLGGWAGSELARSGWESSSAPTFWAVARLLSLVYPEVVSDPETFVLGTPSFRVMIAPECSGYEGVGLVCLYMAFYLCAFQRDLRFPHALALVPVGALAAWSLNALRIAALVVIGDSVSPEFALGGFHSQAGWLAFNAVALGLAFVAHRSRLFARRRAVPGPNPTAAYLSPLLALVAVQMLTEALFNGSPALYPLRVMAAAAVLAYYWRSIDGLGRPAPHARAATGGALWAVLAGVAVFALWETTRVFSAPAAPPGDPREGLAGMPVWAVAAWVVFRAAVSLRRR
jgi:exosortase E/protease (VPEID-CTERM system)